MGVAGGNSVLTNAVETVILSQFSDDSDSLLVSNAGSVSLNTNFFT